MIEKNYQFLLAVVLVLFLGLYADCRQVNAEIRNISTAELHEMMLSKQDFALVNVLPKIIYDSMHLPGSINYPMGKLGKSTSLPFSKDIPLVFYCMGYL